MTDTNSRMTNTATPTIVPIRVEPLKGLGSTTIYSYNNAIQLKYITNFTNRRHR